ncbi:nucleotidyltransferase family protein, partial [Duganella vulcania]
FGHPYPTLQSARDGIDRFLILATCVGATPEAIYAPNGLQMLYYGILTMNSLTPHLELFETKAASYRSRWPWLQSIGLKANVIGDQQVGR